MAFPALDDVEGKIKHINDEVRTFLDQAGPELDMTKVAVVAGDSKAKVDWLRGKEAELAEHNTEREGLVLVQKAADRQRAAEDEGTKGGGEHGAGIGDRAKGGDGAELKSLGDLFVGSPAFKGRQGSNGPEAHLKLDLKALFQTTAGVPPETMRTGKLVEFATTPLDILGLVPETTTAQAAVVYMQETVFTNTAAEVAEGGTYPEAALALEERSSPVRKIAVYLPMTDEQLEDVAYARSYVNSRLPFMVRQRLNTQILVGNGTAPNLRGILNTVGIQTAPLGTDTPADAVHKAIVNIMTIAQSIPNAVAMNPLDWQGIRLERTLDGIYLWGSPSDAGVPRIWGLPVALAQGLPSGTRLVGDFMQSELAVRRGMDVQVSNSHADFFINGKQAVRADIRAAFVVYRPNAFHTVTGQPA